MVLFRCGICLGNPGNLITMGLVSILVADACRSIQKLSGGWMLVDGARGGKQKLGTDVLQE